MTSLIRDSLTHLKKFSPRRMAAALSYYALLSFIPMLFLVVTLSALLFDKPSVEGALTDYLTKILGTSGTAYIKGLLDSVVIEDITILGAIFTGVILIIGSVGIFAEIKKVLSEIWGDVLYPDNETSKIRSMYKKNIITISLIPILALLLAFSMGATLLLTYFEKKVGSFGPIVQILQLVLPLVLGTVLFGIIYRIMPRHTLPWKIIIRGALATTLLFLVGNILITLYLGVVIHFHKLGNATTLVGILLWLFYSSLIFLFGASYTYIYAKRKGAISSREPEQ